MKDEAAMRRILATTAYVTVAMCKDGEPYLVSLSHGYDPEENCIYFHCADEGKKMEFMKANPVVWGQVFLDGGYAQGSCDHLFATVMFRGRVSFLQGQDEKRLALECMIRQLEEDPGAVMGSQMKDESIARVSIGRIAIESMTGKQAKDVIVSL